MTFLALVPSARSARRDMRNLRILIAFVSRYSSTPRSEVLRMTRRELTEYADDLGVIVEQETKVPTARGTG